MNIIDVIGYMLLLLGAVYWLGVIHSTGNWRGERRKQKRPRPSWLMPSVEELFETPKKKLKAEKIFANFEAIRRSAAQVGISYGQALIELGLIQPGEEIPPPESIPAASSPGYILRDDYVPRAVHGNYPSKRRPRGTSHTMSYPPKGTRKAVKSLRQGHWLWSVLFPQRGLPARKGSEHKSPSQVLRGSETHEHEDGTIVISR